MSDYHWLVWEMKNALVNSSHAALFVSAGTKPNSKPLTWNAFPLFFLSDRYCGVREEYFETKEKKNLELPHEFRHCASGTDGAQPSG